MDVKAAAEVLLENQGLVGQAAFLHESMGDSYGMITGISVTKGMLRIEVRDGFVYEEGVWKPDKGLLSYSVNLDYQMSIVEERRGVTRLHHPYWGTMFIFPDQKTFQEFLARELLH